jgi:adenine-specific DNA-methyltransferase
MAPVIHHGDCLDILPMIPDNSVDLVLTDPPYFKVKGDAWDNQWDKPAEFLAWLDRVVEQFARVLKPNGSLYLFASPQMAARVEVLMSERLNVLNHIAWRKDGGIHRRSDKTTLRAFFPQTERIIFAEHYGSDLTAKGIAGYELLCQRLCQRVFQIASLCEQQGVSRADIAGLISVDYKNIESAKAQASNWILGKNVPNRTDFERLRTLLPIVGRYEDLRQQYEAELRKEYEELRRPFSVTADVPYTDVWDFPAVQAYPGKHPCEKPQALLRHIIQTSSRPGAVVLDAFAGSGATGVACRDLGREFIGIEMSDHWVNFARERLAERDLFAA